MGTHIGYFWCSLSRLMEGGVHPLWARLSPPRADEAMVLTVRPCARTWSDSPNNSKHRDEMFSSTTCPRKIKQNVPPKIESFPGNDLSEPMSTTGAASLPRQLRARRHHAARRNAAGLRALLDPLPRRSVVGARPDQVRRASVCSHDGVPLPPPSPRGARGAARAVEAQPVPHQVRARRLRGRGRGGRERVRRGAGRRAPRLSNPRSAKGRFVFKSPPRLAEGRFIFKSAPRPARGRFRSQQQQQKQRQQQPAGLVGLVGPGA